MRVDKNNKPLAPIQDWRKDWKFCEDKVFGKPDAYRHSYYKRFAGKPYYISRHFGELKKGASDKNYDYDEQLVIPRPYIEGDFPWATRRGNENKSTSPWRFIYQGKQIDQMDNDDYEKVYNKLMELTKKINPSSHVAIW